MSDWISALLDKGDYAVKLATSLEFFSAERLKIRPKAGGTVPFIWNDAQRSLHATLEAQKAATGKVRAVILKSRQTGVSTYLAARFYRATISNPGVRTMIVAHEKSASRNLAGMVRRFWDLMPPEHRPSAPTNNADELIFDNDSGYMVSIASPEGAGRSATCQYLHGSEVAYWMNMSEQQAALMQTVPNLPGTEMIFETTADQMGSDFHKLWSRTLAGENAGWIAIFLPWFTDSSCRTDLADDFQMTTVEKELAEMYKLDAQQIYWRRLKLSEMGDEKLFCREYPANPTEAFVSADFDSFITSDLVLAARKTTDIEPYGQLILGVDPAGMGADSTAIAWRRGHCIVKVERHRGLDTMQVAGLVAKLIRDEKPVKVNVDATGMGVGVTDRLAEQNHGDVVNAVNFASKPIEPPALDETGKPAGGCANRRAELYLNLRNALQAGRFSLPDSDELHADLTSFGYSYDSSGKLLLESKQQLRKRGMPSPDLADAVALCFSEPAGSPVVRSASLNWNRKINYPELGHA
jgi:hypothetical protein